MIALPVSGYMLSNAGKHEVSWFGLFTLPNFVPEDKGLAEAAGQAHYLLACAIGVVLVLHMRRGRMARAGQARRGAHPDVAALPAVSVSGRTEARCRTATTGML